MENERPFIVGLGKPGKLKLETLPQIPTRRTRFAPPGRDGPDDAFVEDLSEP
jgi:hypothetical protein